VKTLQPVSSCFPIRVCVMSGFIEGEDPWLSVPVFRRVWLCRSYSLSVVEDRWHCWALYIINAGMRYRRRPLYSKAMGWTPHISPNRTPQTITVSPKRLFCLHALLIKLLFGFSCIGISAHTSRGRRQLLQSLHGGHFLIYTLSRSYPDRASSAESL
jgi:hypothetical protein